LISYQDELDLGIAISAPRCSWDLISYQDELDSFLKRAI
tara:strand:- start:1854 stop:1970 length:117 start_codon:yes stop_codon:yes gene_type:complete